MTSLYLEDFEVGQRFTGGSVRVEEAAIKAFAAEFDPQPFHLEEQAARASLLGGLAASGWHSAALTMRLLVDGGAPIAGGILGAGGELAWPRPTRPDDVLTVESEVLAVTPSRSRPDRGMVTLRSTTVNQNGEAVQVATMKLIVPRRPSTPDSIESGKAGGTPQIQGCGLMRRSRGRLGGARFGAACGRYSRPTEVPGGAKT